MRRNLQCIAAIALLSCPIATRAAPADEVRALVERGQARAAYELGSRHPGELGNPAFDFFFGVAAIDAGHSGEGVLALERYLLTYPDNPSARLQLARGYFALGEDARAREEFESLRATNPPADVAATVDRFLDAIRARETRYRTSTGAYLELGLGYDSNVNSGVANENISLQNLGPVVVGSGSTKTASGQMLIGAGGYVTHPVAPGVSVFGAAQGERRFHDSDAKKLYEQGNYSAAGGISVLRERNLYRFGVNYGVLTVGSPRYRSTLGASAEWQHQLDEQQAFSVGAQYAVLDHPDPNGPRDADFFGISAGYRKLFSHTWQPTLSLGANWGEQRSRADRPDLVPRTLGASASIALTPAAKWGLSVGYLYQQSDYRAQDVILGETRHDRYHLVNAAVSYLYARNLSLRAEAGAARNRSNIELYEFPREYLMLKVRYEFK